eukprot:12362321-Prorocentrum_lima.AAC.1
METKNFGTRFFRDGVQQALQAHSKCSRAGWASLGNSFSGAKDVDIACFSEKDAAILLAQP